MSDFYKLIKACEVESKKDVKIGLIREQKEVLSTRVLFLLMKEETIYTFNTKKINFKIKPLDWDITINNDVDLMDALHRFLDMKLNKSKEMDSILRGLYEACATPELREVVEWILNRKNPASIGVSLINEVWPKLIHIEHYMGGNPGTVDNFERFEVGKPHMLQVKEDGMCITAIPELHIGGVPSIEVRTRQGNDITPFIPITVNNIKRSVHAFMQKSDYKGKPKTFYEAMIRNEDGSVMRREDANGLFNKLTKGEYNADIDSRIFLVCWDICDFNKVEKTKKDPMFVERRYKYVQELSSLSCGFIKAVDSVIVHSYAECRALADKYIREGGEGAMAKMTGQGWSNGKPWHVLKLKTGCECDVRVVGWNPASNDPNLIGSFIIESSCSGMRCNCGSGLDDRLRAMDPELFMGKIYNCEFEELTKSKKSDIVKIKHPRFPKDSFGNLIERFDKNEPDSLKDMIEIEKAEKAKKKKKG